MVRNGRAVFRCRLISEQTGKPRDVPQWMFDSAACCLMQANDEPVVAVKALQRLSQLVTEHINDRSDCGESMLEDQHFHCTKGDADGQNSKSSAAKNSAGAVRASANRSSMDEPCSDNTAGD